MIRFSEYLSEGIIVPQKIKIRTNDIDKLNDQFQSTIISFEDYVDTDAEMRASYIPEIDEIQVYITKNSNFNTIEALVQHEIIHSIQDDKSGMKMAKSIEKERKEQDAITKKIMSMDKEKDIDKIQKLIKKLSDLELKRAFNNHEEYMTYAYMAVKMRKNNVIKDIY